MLAFNFHGTKTKVPESEVPFYIENPYLQPYGEKMNITREQWEKHPHPLEKFIENSHKDTICPLCSNKGHPAHECFKYIRTPAELGIYKQFDLTLHEWTKEIDLYDELPYCT